MSAQQSLVEIARADAIDGALGPSPERERCHFAYRIGHRREYGGLAPWWFVMQSKRCREVIETRDFRKSSQPGLIFCSGRERPACNRVLDAVSLISF